MRSKHQRTLRALFEADRQASLEWSSVEALLVALGGEERQGSGSRVSFIFFERGKAVVSLHRPHGREARIGKRMAQDLQSFLTKIGITP